MHWKRTSFILAAAVIGAAVLASYWRVASPSSGDAAPETAASEPVPIDTPFVTIVDPSKGSKDASITIVEFGDHACPYCRSAQGAIDRLLEEHPKDVRLVWKSAPSPLHPGADVAAEAALCAGRQGKFWQYHARLFDVGAFNQTSVAVLADELDLDSVQFNECIMQGLARPLVERTVTEARALGLTSIPTLFIGGVRYEGALTYDQLLEATGL